MIEVATLILKCTQVKELLRKKTPFQDKAESWIDQRELDHDLLSVVKLQSGDPSTYLVGDINDRQVI